MWKPCDKFTVFIECYEWLMCYLMDSTFKRMQQSTANGSCKFAARNNAQVYLARDLTRSYAEYYALKSFQKRLTLPDITDSLRPTLVIMYQIYGYWCLERHLATFYQGRFASTATSSSNSFADIVRSELLRLCGEIKDSAVAVVDALAPPDFALNSIIGKSDGLVSVFGPLGVGFIQKKQASFKS